MDGILIIDKPAGLTSHDVVARVRRILRLKRVGHTGTLDPFATGVLVVLVGRATRLAQFLSGAEKEYEAVVRFGYATETGDLTGAPRKEKATLPASQLTGPEPAELEGPSPEVESLKPESLNPQLWTMDEIEAVLAGLRGEIEQLPPMYSAKKVAGEKLYELARRGLEVERKAALVKIDRLEAFERQGSLLQRNEEGTCDMGLRVVCSAGTYIRVLAEQIGERLGSPAHLAALRRTRAGSFKITEAVTLDQLEQRRQQQDNWTSLLISPDAALSELPALHLSAEEARRARHGIALNLLHEHTSSAQDEWQEGQQVRMVEEGAGLIAVGVYDALMKLLRPRVVIATDESVGPG